MIYKMARLSEPMAIDANWDKPAWQNIQPLQLGNFVGNEPEHRPQTQTKLAYDSEAIYIIFQVRDQYVRSIWQNYQEDVWQDSCVEFFFKPNNDRSENYFNLEMNCGGTALFAYQTGPRQGEIRIPESEYKAITVAHSMPKLVDPEITDPTTWTVEYRLPLAVLGKYCAVESPAPGVTWKANFYKIANETSHPHYLTWAPLDIQKVEFHLPQFFGTLEFE